MVVVVDILVGDTISFDIDVLISSELVSVAEDVVSNVLAVLICISGTVVSDIVVIRSEVVSMTEREVSEPMVFSPSVEASRKVLEAGSVMSVSAKTDVSE